MNGQSRDTSNIGHKIQNKGKHSQTNTTQEAKRIS